MCRDMKKYIACIRSMDRKGWPEYRAPEEARRTCSGRDRPYGGCGCLLNGRLLLTVLARSLLPGMTPAILSPSGQVADCDFSSFVPLHDPFFPSPPPPHHSRGPLRSDPRVHRGFPSASLSPWRQIAFISTRKW